VAYRFFDLADNPRVETHDADARPFLRRTDRRYDLIYADAYHQPYVPFYLATTEFFELASSRLRPGGILALNVATVPGDRRLVRALAETLATVFPEARIWPVLRFNHVVIGLTRPGFSFGVVPDAAVDVLVDSLRASLSDPVRPADDPWTDDHAPVEWITDRMIVSYAARGGDLDEDQLPTAPE
jgi:hypothetical protein